MPSLNVRVKELPLECLGWTNFELLLPTPNGFLPGQAEGDDLVFAIPFAIRADRSGVLQPSGDLVKREGDGRRFVYLAWSGEKEGVRTPYGRIKLFFEQVPGYPSDNEEYEVTISGRDPKGRPACARARVLSE